MEIFELCKEIEIHKSGTKKNSHKESENIFHYFFTVLKTYHLPHSFYNITLSWIITSVYPQQGAITPDLSEKKERLTYE